MAQSVEGASSIYGHKGLTMLPRSPENVADLSTLSHYLVGCDALEELAEDAARQIVDALGLDYCRIILVDENGHYSCSASFPRAISLVGVIKSFEPSLAEAVYARLMDPQSSPRMLLAQEYLSPAERANLGIHDNEVTWVIPLSIETSGLGALIIGQRMQPGRRLVKKDSYYLLDLISDQVSQAIQKQKVHHPPGSLSIRQVVTLIQDLETRDSYSATHSRRMATLAEQLASHFRFSVRETRELCWAALLHDIGKLWIDEEILKKAGPLNDAEWQVMKTHPENGARIISGLPGLEELAPLILTHHERVDGQGYPRGLVGDEIPLGGRILAVIDSYSVMVEGRPYRKKCTHAAAMAELVRNSGKAFDADVVDIFARLFIR